MRMLQPEDMVPLAQKLFSESIISQAVFDSTNQTGMPITTRKAGLQSAIFTRLSFYPGSYSVLLDILREQQVYQDIAEAIEETYKTLGSLTPPLTRLQPHTAISKYAEYQRAGYKRTKPPLIMNWTSNPCQKVIQLAAVETKGYQYTRGQPHLDPRKFSKFPSMEDYILSLGGNVHILSLATLLDPKDGGEPPKSVIVQGAPGIGKSTFAWKCCRDWANGKLYPQYDLVCLIRMRDRKVQEANELKDLFTHLNKELLKSVADEIIARNGDRVIFFFEGLDELPTNFLSGDSFLKDILTAIPLPLLTIIVTTRPWAAQKLANLLEDQNIRRVDILGFLQKDIIDYAEHSFQDGSERAAFMEYFHTHPQLEMIMYVPLNSAFVVEIYKYFTQNRSNEEFPHTLTQLYKALVKRHIAKYMMTMPEFASSSPAKVVSLRKLPEPVASIFEHICKIAFFSFTKGNIQVSFTESDVANVDSLGLMQTVSDTSMETESSLIHAFIHFTVQEFLAAYYLSLQPPEQQQLFFETHQEEQKFSVLLSFLIGLNSSVIKHLQPSFVARRLQPHLLHWLFESQSPHDVATFLGTDLIYFQTYHKLAPIDIYSLTYCLRYSSCTWSLIIDLEDLTTVYKPLESGTDGFSGSIDELSIFNAKGISIEKFFTLPARLFKSVQFLYFFNREDIETEPKYYAVITSLLSMFKQLTEFQLNDANKEAGPGCVIDALGQHCSLLETLKIERCLFTTSDIIPLCSLISSPASRLCRLALVDVNFGTDSLQQLSSALPCSQSLKRLDLSFNNLTRSDNEFEMLVFGVATSSLEAARFRSCSIGLDGMEVFAEYLKENSTLEFLSLTHNVIHFRGAAALADLLRENATLKDVRISGDDTIGRDGAALLIDSLNSNKTLERIELSERCRPIEYGSVVLPMTHRVIFS